MLDAAKTLLIDLLLENDAVKNLSPDFVSASNQWLRNWLQRDSDAITRAILDSAGNEPLKKLMVEEKLPALLQNASFSQELLQLFAQYAQQKERQKNVVENSQIDVKGNAVIGDNGPSVDDGYDQKNKVSGSTLSAGGDVRVGDQNLQAGGNIHFGDIHYHGAPPPAASRPGGTISSTTAQQLRDLVASGRTGDAIAQLRTHTEQNDTHLRDEVSQLSARWENLKRRERIGVINYSEATLERNQLNNALLELIGGLGS